MKYFSANGILGRNAIFNQVYSDRSDGKTFDIKYRGLMRFKKYGYTTVYVRRWKTEISKAMQDTFLNEVFKVYPELDIWDIRASKEGIMLKRRGVNEPFKYAFYFVAISISNRIKSNFDTTWIREIDFDEYVPLDNRYAPDEMLSLLELYNTCDRDRYIVKLCTFGNRITGSNPFLDFFDIHPDLTNIKIRTYKEGSIAIQVYKCDERRELKAKSTFAKAVEGTIYDSYMKGGILELGTAIIKHKPSDAAIWSAFRTNLGYGSIWADGNGKYYICDKKVDCGFIITDQAYGEQDEVVITMGQLTNFFKTAYRSSSLYATSERAWSIFQPMIDIINLK